MIQQERLWWIWRISEVNREKLEAQSKNSASLLFNIKSETGGLEIITTSLQVNKLETYPSSSTGGSRGGANLLQVRELLPAAAVAAAAAATLEAAALTLLPL